MTAKYKAFDYAASKLWEVWCIEDNPADYLYETLRTYLLVLIDLEDEMIMTGMEDSDGSN